MSLGQATKDSGRGLLGVVVAVLTTDPPQGGSITVALEDQFDRAGLRGCVQFNEYTHTHTHTHATFFFCKVRIRNSLRSNKKLQARRSAREDVQDLQFWRVMLRNYIQMTGSILSIIILQNRSILISYTLFKTGIRPQTICLLFLSCLICKFQK